MLRILFILCFSAAVTLYGQSRPDLAPEQTANLDDVCFYTQEGTGELRKVCVSSLKTLFGVQAINIGYTPGLSGNPVADRNTIAQDPLGDVWLIDADGDGKKLSLAGPAGADGESAYEIAVANGYVGDEASWLASLEGDDGNTGPVGPAGPADWLAIPNVPPDIADGDDVGIPLQASGGSNAPNFSGRPDTLATGVVRILNASDVITSDGVLATFRIDNDQAEQIIFDQLKGGVATSSIRPGAATPFEEWAFFATQRMPYVGRLFGEKWIVSGDSFSNNVGNDWIADAAGITGLIPSTIAVSGHRVDQQNSVIASLVSANPSHFDSCVAFTVLAGVNDWSQDSELGSPADVVNSSTVCGQLKGIIEKVLISNPLVEFYLISPTDGEVPSSAFGEVNQANVPWTLEDLRNAYSEIAFNYRIQFIDAFAGSQFNNITIAEMSYDNLHPNPGTGTRALGELVGWAMISKGNYGSRNANVTPQTADEVDVTSGVFNGLTTRVALDQLNARSEDQTADEVSVTAGVYSGLNVRQALDLTSSRDRFGAQSQTAGGDTNDWQQGLRYGTAAEFLRGNLTNGPGGFAFYHRWALEYGGLKDGTGNLAMLMFPDDAEYRTGNVQGNYPLLFQTRKNGVFSKFYSFAMTEWGESYAINVDSLGGKAAGDYDLQPVEESTVIPSASKVFDLDVDQLTVDLTGVTGTKTVSLPTPLSAWVGKEKTVLRIDDGTAILNIVTGTGADINNQSVIMLTANDFYTCRTDGVEVLCK